MSEDRDGFLGIEHIPFNWRLRRAREAMGMSRRQLASATGLTPSSVGSYEALRIWPSPTSALKIADALQDEVGYLFPPEVGVAIRGHRPARLESVLPAETLSIEGTPSLRLIAAHGGPDGEAAVRALTASMKTSLSSLNPQERRVLKMRFGFDGPEMSAQEIADAAGLSRGRIYQIEQKALRKMRHPSLSRRLRDYMQAGGRDYMQAGGLRDGGVTVPAMTAEERREDALHRQYWGPVGPVRTK